jgi:hypothetical protein
MNTKTLSTRSLSVIEQYKNFTVGPAACSIPYFNNKTLGSRVALRAYVGKGSPKDIYEEVTACLTKDHVTLDVLTPDSLKKYITDKNIGIDCSGLSYYILNAEDEERGKGHLDKHLHFTNCGGLFGKIRCAMRPVENCGVNTFADNKNSHVMSLKEMQPGDMITMISKVNDRDHMLVIHQVEYQNFLPIKLHYTHTIAYPEDGVYGTGVKQGTIEIVNPEKSILDCLWSETNLLAKMPNYLVEIRRLNWL